jgi:hypothetical protein
MASIPTGREEEEEPSNVSKLNNQDNNGIINEER